MNSWRVAGIDVSQGRSLERPMNHDRYYCSVWWKSDDEGKMALVGQQDMGFAPHQGTDYLRCLAHIHQTLKPESYLEIGTSSGATLRLAGGISVAVDPDFQIDGDVMGSKRALHMFRQTSDDFFRERHLPNLITRPLACAFLDGLHWAEYLLRDFMNTERYCNKESLILMHDCLPLDLPMAIRDANDFETRSRSIHPSWWTGDVWKVVYALQLYRPDLFIECYDAPPTGLVVIRNLDANSKVLDETYRAILAIFENDTNDALMFQKLRVNTVVQSTDKLFQWIDQSEKVGI